MLNVEYRTSNQFWLLISYIMGLIKRYNHILKKPLFMVSPLLLKYQNPKIKYSRHSVSCEKMRTRGFFMHTARRADESRSLESLFFFRENFSRRSQNDEKGTHIKGRLLDQAVASFTCILFQMGTSLKGENLLPEGANSFLYEQFLIERKITFTT